MSAAPDIEREIIQAIRQWIEAEHLTQRQAAERLRIRQSNLNSLLRERRSYTLDRLLEIWKRAGGLYTFRAFRTEEVSANNPPDRHRSSDRTGGSGET